MKNKTVLDQLPLFMYNKGDRMKLLRQLLKMLGDPDKKYKIIHVCGTNGKGSTSTLISSILRRMNYTTGLFTSPHIESVRERIKINGVEITKDHFRTYEKK